MLKSKKLNAKRGDVVIFNNTSAEHSKTYDFARKMKKITEEQYNIPFFWIEYQTYEDSNGSYKWSRKPTYRLVNEYPYSENNKNGYRYKGEIFEEIISYSGYLPNMLSRTCTQSMKIFITNAFLSDWFAQKNSIERLGHYGKVPKMSDKYIIDNHHKHGGEVPNDILLNKKKFVRDMPFVREGQFWKDWTKADIVIDNNILHKSMLGGKAQLYGESAVKYISILGIRGDEQKRIIKIENRIDEAQENKGKSLFNQPHGENILAPLNDENITSQQVIDFWNKQDFDLELPDNGLFSNCLYCPLKGKNKLLNIAIQQKNNKFDELTPENIDWWINIERKYSRNLEAEDRKITEKGTKFVGFFGGVDKLVFEQIKKDALTGVSVDKDLLNSDDSVPCNCTD
jgi:3'-phosphoadenosine 5'-phosphosulfate sulfotransferase (PAPS reductase)/FAD synthetase